MVEPTRGAFLVNGREVRVPARPNTVLARFLREDLGLVGTKVACGVGVCGTCTVLADGMAVSSCLLPTVCVEGMDVWTIEGVADDAGRLGAIAGALQRSFVANDALQCGICTPGQIMGALALLRESPDPEEDEIRHTMSGNLCRCTGYESIVHAVLSAAEDLRTR